jgi:hypothetical protein
VIQRKKQGAIMSLDQAWSLSQKWYGNRLDLEFRRPTPDEAKEIFESAGLTGEFWSLG